MVLFLKESVQALYLESVQALYHEVDEEEQQSMWRLGSTWEGEYCFCKAENGQMDGETGWRKSSMCKVPIQVGGIDFNMDWSEEVIIEIWGGGRWPGRRGP